MRYIRRSEFQLYLIMQGISIKYATNKFLGNFTSLMPCNTQYCGKVLRGCSQRGELAQLGGLARLGEISPSLRNSYKNIMCSFEK